MDVVLDTNIYQANFAMQSNQVASMNAYLIKTDDHLFIPYIVAQELTRNYKAALQKSFEEIEKVTRSFDKLVVNHELNEISKGLHSFKNYQQNISSLTYIEYLRGFIPNTIVEDTLPPIDFGKVVMKGLDKVKPFKVTGEGMKDAILWESILEYCKTQSINRIIFISNNSNDFGKETLEPNLLAQSKAAGVDIVFYNGLAMFIENEFATVEGVELRTSDIDVDMLKIQLGLLFSKKVDLQLFYDKHNTANDTYFDYQGINYFEIFRIENFIVKDINTEFKYVHARIICKVSIVLAHENYRIFTGHDGDMDYDHSVELDELPATIWADITLKRTNDGFSDLQLNETGFAE